MKNFICQLTFLMVLLIEKKQLQPTTTANPYGNPCGGKCDSFKCGDTGNNDGRDCWYNCCWMTMSKNKQTFFSSYKHDQRIYFLIIITKYNWHIYLEA